MGIFYIYKRILDGLKEKHEKEEERKRKYEEFKRERGLDRKKDSDKK